MPNNIIKSFAKESGKSEEEIEHLWNKAKSIVKKDYNAKEDDEKFYKLVTGVLKKMLSLKEDFTTSTSDIAIHAEKMGSRPFERMDQIKRKKLKEEGTTFQKLEAILEEK